MLSNHRDNTGTVNIQIYCYRSERLLTKWRISTYEAIKTAHIQLVENFEAARERTRFEALSEFTIGDAPRAVNLQREQDELKKWSIKLLRGRPLDFDAVVGEGEVDAPVAEVDPSGADAMAPVVRFFENSFEWNHMSYFLYPYFWVVVEHGMFAYG